MDIALMVLGLLALAVVLVWAYSFLSDPKDIDQEEERGVREETPAERERAAFEQTNKDRERNAEDIILYSPGEEASE